MSDPARVNFHPHARARLGERGATEEEAVLTVRAGERFSAKFDRSGFRRNFPYNAVWMGRMFATKQIEAFAVFEHGAWLVLTVIVKYF